MLTKKKTTWILVCDGARGRILVNRGRSTGLREIEKAEDENARRPTRELGTDKPGRAYESSGTSRHAMAPPTDWHRFEKEHFTKGMAAIINEGALSDRFDRLIVVAPPRVLGDLRAALAPQAAERVAAEINKDLTNVPSHDIGTHLADHVRL